MAAIQVDGYEIRKGNFQIFADVLENEALSEVFFEMEKNFQTDREMFAANLRKVYELFVMEEYLRLNPCDRNDVENIMENDMNVRKYENPQASNLKSASKIFLVLQCCRTEYASLFDKALEWFRVWSKSHAKWSLDKLSGVDGIRQLILQLYAFGSEQHHASQSQKKKSYEATEENCRIFYHAFYFFLRAYCEIYSSKAERLKYAKPEIDAGPLNDYIPLSNAHLKEIGVKKPKGKRYYISENAGKIKYFLVCDVDKTVQTTREIEVLQNIWADDNDFEPNNIIRFKEELVISPDKSKLVFSLPSKPNVLSSRLLEQMSNKDKVKVFTDAIKAISSLHNNMPAFYHRDITPEVFTVCNARNGYKLFLNTFECVKNTDPDVVQTMRTKVAGNLTDKKKKAYIAPEIMALEDHSEDWLDADWQKADIYSLGILGVYIFTGDTKLENLDAVEGLDAAWKEKIRKMCASFDERISEI